MDDVQPRLQQVFRKVFADPALELRDEMTAADIDGWDSLAHINLIIAIEREFKIKFAMAQISKMKDPGQNVGSMKKLLEQKLGKSPQ
jgi:acyl carrier protein